MRLTERLKQLSNPIDWSYTEKTLLGIGLNTSLFALFFLIASVSLLVPEFRSASNPAALTFTWYFSLGCMAMWGILFVIVYRLRQRDPDAIGPAIITVYLFGAPMMVMAVLNGIHSIVTGILLASAPIFGLILFNNRHVYIATVLNWMGIILIGIGVNLGWLPDAPLYLKTFASVADSQLWLLIQVLIGLPSSFMMLLIVIALLHGLRQREQKILELSRRDGLTGVWNRRYLMERLEHELAVARRSQRPLSLILLDLDHFKHINDRYGHATGDRVLIEAARTLQGCIRDIDHLGRYGGEEFVVLLPFCDTDMAVAIAERCRRHIESLAIRHEGEAIPVTSSFGVTTLPVGATSTGEALTHSADLGLYRAKAEGRNRVVRMALTESPAN
ncbi:MAG: GGDEF domain-containing protein [Gammaproteobacteria bacterium]